MKRRTVAIALLTLTTAALTACSSTKDQNPQVADLPAPGAGTSSSTDGKAAVPADGADTAGRPRLRIDMTDAEFHAMFAPLDRCMSKQPGITDKSDPAKYEASTKAALEVCKRFQPLPPAQVDAANPQARAFIGLVVTCLQGKGFQARAELYSDQWGVKYSNDEQIISSEKPEADCMKQVAAKN